MIIDHEERREVDLDLSSRQSDGSSGSRIREGQGTPLCPAFISFSSRIAFFSSFRIVFSIISEFFAIRDTKNVILCKIMRKIANYADAPRPA